MGSKSLLNVVIYTGSLFIAYISDIYYIYMYYAGISEKAELTVVGLVLRFGLFLAS